jgi:hypothetical protein
MFIDRCVMFISLGEVMEGKVSIAVSQEPPTFRVLKLSVQIRLRAV